MDKGKMEEYQKQRADGGPYAKLYDEEYESMSESERKKTDEFMRRICEKIELFDKE